MVKMKSITFSYSGGSKDKPQGDWLKRKEATQTQTR